MPDTPEPVLTYDRIDANRRKTRLLLASFAAMALPVVSAATVYVMPLIVLAGFAVAYQIYGGASLFTKLESLGVQVDGSRSKEGTLDLLDLPAPILLMEGGAMAVALVVVVLALVGVTVFLISRYGSRAVLRAASARPVEPDREPYLVRVVENLCIGAGLPLPSIHIVESGAPNAFAIGRDPQHASLVVTRGLLTLLDRRELEGVLAHELSHIGNHDIRLSTTLAALVGTLSLPFRMAAAPFRFVFKLPWGYRILALFVGFQFFSMVLWTYWFGLEVFSDPDMWEGLPSFLWWWVLHAMVAPPYTVFVAPVLALLIRQAVSRQREFLADADAALLTRDPEGLALALVKVAAARGDRLRVGEGSVHLYFADPLAKGDSLMHWMFPSHPTVEQRIALLARMGSGITPADLQRAREAGARTEKVASSSVEIVTPRSGPQSEGVNTDDDGSRVKLSDAPARDHSLRASEEDAVGGTAGTSLTPLYEQPDGWSRVLRQLPPDAVVKPVGRQGGFIRVLTNDDVAGYVSSLARLPAVKQFSEKGVS